MHYVWALHVHDVLNRTADVRFMPGVRVNLVRGSYGRLAFGPREYRPLGEYVTDAMGNCETLVALDNRSLSSEALLGRDVEPASAFGRLFDGRFAPMAQQCGLARLDDPVICCGNPARSCGRHVCGADFSAASRGFERAAREVDRKERARAEHELVVAATRKAAARRMRRQQHAAGGARG